MKGIRAGNVRALNAGQVHFGFDLDTDVDMQLQTAAACVHDRDASLQALNAARQQAPERLEVLQALYKFHFYRGDLQQALDIVFQSLIKASLQGGFRHDWDSLDMDSADWNDPRGPARSYLYSLKALAFIRLRQNDIDEAKRILAVLDRIDPLDQVGANVIRDLAEGVDDDSDD